MSKTKPSGLIHYEILFIMPNRFTDEEAQGIFKKVGQLISSLEGNITLENYWGKKKFAYPINHELYGYYGLYEFDLERNLIAEINNKLRLDNDVLRFLIIRKDLKNEAQLKKDAKIKEKIETKKAKAQEEDQKKEEKITKTPKKSVDKKIDLKNLDEKLEDVLNIDNLL